MNIRTEKCIVTSEDNKEYIFLETSKILLEEENSAICFGEITEIFEGGISFRKHNNIGNFYIPFKNIVRIVDNT